MVQLLYIAVAVAAGFALTAVAVKIFPAQFLRENFQQRRIPNAYGLVFVIAGGIYFAILCSPIQTSAARFAFLYLLTLLAFGFLGLVDDLAGDRSAGGLGGHFRVLVREHRLTTGAIKAGGGIVVACWAAAQAPTLHHAPWLVRAILIAGMANSLNLVDLRPGRCLALFIVAALALIVYAGLHDLLGVSHFLYAALPLDCAVIVALSLYIGERNAVFMLGDTGSNAFGALLGLSVALFAPGFFQWLAAAAILVFHIWTERNSFSKLIERTPVLRAIDRKIGVR